MVVPVEEQGGGHGSAPEVGAVPPCPDGCSGYPVQTGGDLPPG